VFAFGVPEPARFTPSLMHTLLTVCSHKSLPSLSAMIHHHAAMIGEQLHAARGADDRRCLRVLAPQRSFYIKDQDRRSSRR